MKNGLEKKNVLLFVALCNKVLMSELNYKCYLTD